MQVFLQNDFSDHARMSEPKITPAEALQNLERTKAIAAAMMCGANIGSVAATQYRKLGCSDELLARLNMSGATIRSPNLFRDPLSKDNHITGKVGGCARKPRRRAILWEITGAATNQPNLMYPVSRSARPVSEGGGRTFHMRETIVHAGPTITQSATKARQNYVLDASKVPIVEAQLAGVQLERGLYLFRDKVKVENEGLRLAATSLGPDDASIVNGWQLIVRTEKRKVKNPIRPYITIHKAKSSKDGFWDELCEEPDIPEELKTFLLDEEAKEVTFVDDEVEPIVCFLRKNDWHERKKGKRRDDIKYQPGRAAIVQRRLVFELPVGLSLEAVERISHDLAREFHERGLPFVLVVHRPDENNHESNWHIHLDYHHRPMRRFDPSNYALPPLPKGAGKKMLAQRAIAEKALAEPDPAWTGKWDAEIEYEYRTSSGRKKVSYPFVQDVHPHTRDKDWLKNLRVRFAEIVNGELERVQSEVRFDPRRLVEMGIDKIPDQHLDLKLSNLERVGTPTRTGAQNEQNHWDYEHAELLKNYPGGDKASGKPEHVAGYVTGCMKLVQARLISRAEFIKYYSQRQADSDLQTNPTPSTTRRNRRRDNRFEELAELARSTLANLNEVWEGISAWSENLEGRLLSYEETSQNLSKDESVASGPKAGQAASRKPSAGNPAKAVTQTTARATSLTRASRTPQDTSRKSPVAAPANKVAAPPPVHALLGLMEKHQLDFQLDRFFTPAGKWALVAKLNETDASQLEIPQQVAAVEPAHKRSLMELADRQFARKEKARDVERAASGSKIEAPRDPAMPVVETAHQSHAKQDSPRAPVPVAEVGRSDRQIRENEPSAAQATASGFKSDGSTLPPRKNAGIDRPTSQNGGLDGLKREKMTEPRKTKVSEVPAQARTQIRPQMHAESTPVTTLPLDGHPSTNGTFPERESGKHKPSENQTAMESVRQIDDSRPKVAEAERKVASKPPHRQPSVVTPSPHRNAERDRTEEAGRLRVHRHLPAQGARQISRSGREVAGHTVLANGPDDGRDRETEGAILGTCGRALVRRAVTMRAR